MHDSEHDIEEEYKMRSVDRAHLVLVFGMIAVAIIIARAAYIQLFRHSYYIGLADKQYISTIPSSFDRGTILYSNYGGAPVPAAQLATTYRIAIDPTVITDANTAYQKLSQYLPLDKEVFVAKATKKNDPY